MEAWKKRARTQQQNFAVSLGDRTWDRFATPAQDQELLDKISFAFVGPPRDGGYTKEEKELVSEVVEKCKENGNEKAAVTIAFLFVCAYKGTSTEATFPLIRVKKNDGRKPTESFFIDHIGRVYKDWSEFLSDNIFDGWWICTPEDAEYMFSGQDVRLSYYDQSKRGVVVGKLDTLSAVAGITTSISMTAGLAMTFFPPTALFGGALVAASSIVGAPAAAYGTGRSVHKLVDRGTHQQSLNPFASSEARACWLTTTASVFSLGTMASGQILASTAKAGYLAGSGTRIFCTALNVSALSVNGLGVINSIYEVAKKDEVTTLDVVQLSTSILFFTHSAVTFKTASTIIKDAQMEAIAASRQSLPAESREAFDHMLKSRREMVEPGKVREMHGNKEFIRDLKTINNIGDFFQHFKVVRGNQLSVNNELLINGKAFLQMSPRQRSALIQLSDDLKNNRITEVQFNDRVQPFKSNYRIAFNKELAKASQKIENILGSKIGNCALSDLKPHEVQRLDQVMSTSGKNYKQSRVDVAKAMADRMECQNITEVTAATEYAIRRLESKVAEMRQSNPNPSRPQGVKPKDFYFEQVADQFLTDTQLQDNIVRGFRHKMAKCSVENSKGNIGFGNAMAAANHYDKHAVFPQIDPNNNNISAESYFEIAREMCSDDIQNPVWVQDGSALICRFESHKYGAVAIRYDNLADGKSVIATLFSANLDEILIEPHYFFCC